MWRVARRIESPDISEKRLSLTEGGYIRFQLKTPYRDGTTHMIFEPLDFVARLAALVPKPRVNVILRGESSQSAASNEPEEQTPAERHAAMIWA